MRVYVKKTHCIRGHELTPENRRNGTGQCKTCSRINQQKHNQEHPEYRKNWRDKHKERLRTEHVSTRYGISQEAYSLLLETQNNRCACCGIKFDDSVFNTTPHVDHDHECCPGVKSCGKCVRGLLCRGCNVGLGALQDSVPVLYKAIYYLERSRTKGQA